MKKKTTLRFHVAGNSRRLPLTITVTESGVNYANSRYQASDLEKLFISLQAYLEIIPLTNALGEEVRKLNPQFFKDIYQDSAATVIPGGTQMDAMAVLDSLEKAASHVIDTHQEGTAVMRDLQTAVRRAQEILGRD